MSGKIHSSRKLLGGILLGTLAIVFLAGVLLIHYKKTANTSQSNVKTQDVSRDSNGSAVQLTQNTAIPTGISCTSSQFCVVTDDTGNVYTYNGSGWSQPESLASSLSDISCPNSNFCVAIGTNDAYIYQNGSWGTGSAAPDQGALSAISCPTTSFCMVVDENGGASVFNGSSWGPVAQIEMNNSTGLQSVSCSSPDFCVATDSSNGAVKYNGHSWESVTSVTESGDYNTPASFAQPESVSCPSSRYCIAVDKFGNAFTFNGTSWSKGVAIEKNAIAAISCPTSTWCLAVAPHGSENKSYTGYFMKMQNSSWTAPQVADNGAGINVVSCSSSTFCMGVDADMYTQKINL